MEGKTDYLNVNANSVADIYRFDFSAKNSDILATSASDVRVTIKDEAHFNVSSAADIIYKGSPAIINSKTSSLGEVRKARF